MGAFGCACVWQARCGGRIPRRACSCGSVVPSRSVVAGRDSLTLTNAPPRRSGPPLDSATQAPAARHRIIRTEATLASGGAVPAPQTPFPRTSHRVASPPTPRPPSPWHHSLPPSSRLVLRRSRRRHTPPTPSTSISNSTSTKRPITTNSRTPPCPAGPAARRASPRPLQRHAGGRSQTRTKGPPPSPDRRGRCLSTGPALPPE